MKGHEFHVSNDAEIIYRSRCFCSQIRSGADLGRYMLWFGLFWNLSANYVFAILQIVHSRCLEATTDEKLSSAWRELDFPDIDFDTKGTILINWCQDRRRDPLDTVSGTDFEQIENLSELRPKQ